MAPALPKKPLRETSSEMLGGAKAAAEKGSFLQSGVSGPDVSQVNPVKNLLDKNIPKPG